MPGGRLRAERPRLALLGPRREPEQLLLDDVGDLADAALEDRGLLEQRRLDRLVAVALGEVGGDPLEPRERGALGAAGGRGCRAGRGRSASSPKSSRRPRPTAQLRSRWTLMTSLSPSIRLITRASCETEATWSVAVTIAVWSGFDVDRGGQDVDLVLGDDLGDVVEQARSGRRPRPGSRSGRSGPAPPPTRPR